MRAFRGTVEVSRMKSVLVLSEGLLSRVVYRDKEKVAWGTIMDICSILQSGH